MTDGFITSIAVIFGFAFSAALFAWVTVLPAIGVLWLFGALS